MAATLFKSCLNVSPWGIERERYAKKKEWRLLEKGKRIFRKRIRESVGGGEKRVQEREKEVKEERKKESKKGQEKKKRERLKKIMCQCKN